MEKKIRLDKFLADMGKGSRSQIREAARKGRIHVNGQMEKSPERKIEPKVDEVFFDGENVLFEQFRYFLMNKPKGVVSATKDKKYKTVVDLLEEENQKDLFPVGRLDLDTEGLLLLTNDGELAHQLLSPKKHVDKTYFARVSGTLPDNAKEQMADGMTLTDGTKVLPAKLQILTKGFGQETGIPVLLTIQEGKFHQVKRMFEAMGCKVEYLKRMSMGPLTLEDSLLPGQYRRLTEKEIERLTNIQKFQKFKNQGPEVLQALTNMDAVIFDLDGTLVDSMWMWKTIDVEYLGRYHIPYPEFLQREIEGMSFSETAVYFKKTFQIPDSIEEIKKTWVEMSLEKYQKQVPLKSGVRGFLDYLREQKIQMGIATSNGWDLVNEVLDVLKIREYFQVIATACEVAAGKPAPDVYLYVAGQLGVKPERCMVFEDVPAGIRSGKAAGMTVCGVEDDYSAHMGPEKRMLADYFIESYDQLFEEEKPNG